MTGDIKVVLQHAIPNERRRTLYMRARQDHEEQYPGENVGLETTIHNGRGSSLKFDEAAFELFQHPTALATEDFYAAPEKIQSQYYEEMKALFTKVTGSPHVLVFHHQVRNQDKADDRVLKDGGVTTSTPVQPYAHGIHTDSSCFHAEEFFKAMVMAMPENCRRGRFLYINAWRNISVEPIEQNHLAVLDERSLVKPDDYIQTELHGVGYDVLQYNLSARNARQHKWYYFPKMTNDEVLVFKQYDSDPLKSGRLCFHTAIHDPTASASAPSRQSIETRAFVFFPEHEPNTCPLMPVADLPATGADGIRDEPTARSGAEKIMNGLIYIQSDESTRATVVGHFRAMYTSGGARAVLAAFSEDTEGHFGLKSANAETKELAVEIVLEGGGAKRVEAIFDTPSDAGPSRAQWLSCLFKEFNKSHAGAATLGAMSALAVSAMLRRISKY